MTLITFTRAPMRFIELRCVDPRRGHWQAIYAGDEWTNSFITGIGQRWLVEDALRHLETCRGLPVIVTQGEPIEVAA